MSVREADTDRVGTVDASATEGVFTAEEREMLLDLAEVAIRAYLEGVTYPGSDVTLLPEALLHPCNAFVNLHLGRDFYGCHGSLDPDTPVGECIPCLAVDAAFEMARGRPLRRTDLSRIRIEISVLESRRPIPAGSRAAILEGLRPGVDGLRIVSGGHSAVLLPAAWRYRNDPDRFIDRVMLRAGLDPTVWPDDMEAEILQTTDFGRQFP